MFGARFYEWVQSRFMENLRVKAGPRTGPQLARAAGVTMQELMNELSSGGRGPLGMTIAGLML